MTKSTTKKVSSSSNWNSSFQLSVLTGRKEKVNGKRYSLEEAYTGKLLAVLPIDTILVECEDKWYQPYIEGRKLFFRIGGLIMEQLKLREIVL